ncbi:hypothetical protein TNCV_1936971 [Trichonephila clavipes]|nr:hypothetical protein TNCV_1936971 [Trichonephila clavipes]
MSTSDRKFLLSKHQPNAERVLTGEITIFHRDQLSNRYRTDFESCAATVFTIAKEANSSTVIIFFVEPWEGLQNIDIISNKE